MSRKSDPAAVFAAGKRGVQTIYRALLDDDPAIQLAAARMAYEAATKLPAAIDDERRAVGERQRAGLTAIPSGQGGRD
jgi:hypothetical protein